MPPQTEQRGGGTGKCTSLSSSSPANLGPVSSVPDPRHASQSFVAPRSSVMARYVGPERRKVKTCARCGKLRAMADKKTCSQCGQQHGECFICESVCFADGSVERALFVGFCASLGVQLTSGTGPHAVVQLMLGKLCKEHRELWNKVSNRTVSRMQAGRS